MASEQLIKQIEQLLFLPAENEDGYVVYDRVEEARDAGVQAHAEGYRELGMLLIEARTEEDVRDALTFNWPETKVALRASLDLGWDLLRPWGTTPRTLPFTANTTPSRDVYEDCTRYCTRWGAGLLPSSSIRRSAEWVIATGDEILLDNFLERDIVFFVSHASGLHVAALREFREDPEYGNQDYSWRRVVHDSLNDFAALVLKASTVFPRFIAGVHELIAKTAELRTAELRS